MNTGRREYGGTPYKAECRRLSGPAMRRPPTGGGRKKAVDKPNAVWYDT